MSFLIYFKKLENNKININQHSIILKIELLGKKEEEENQLKKFATNK